MTTIASGIIKPGKVDYDGFGSKRNACEIKWELSRCENGHCFTASGGVWDSRHSDYTICGQIVSEIASWFPDNSKLQYIAAIHALYHLNDTKAGLPAQEHAIYEWKAAGNAYDYTLACEYLKSVGLYEMPICGAKCTGNFPSEVLDGTRGYRYGARWIYSDIPQDVIDQLIAFNEEL